MGQPSIEDRVLIRELYDRYHWAFNTGDPDGLKACFVPGAQLTTYSGHVVTPDIRLNRRAPGRMIPLAAPVSITPRD